MNLKFLIITLLGLVIPISLCSVDISVANIYEFSDFDGLAENENSSVTSDLIKYIIEKDLRYLLTVEETKSLITPKSILEIKTICTKENIEYILYGFLQVNQYSFDLEVKLYDHTAGKIQKIFYSKSDIDSYTELIETIGDRILNYFYKELGFSNDDKGRESSFFNFEIGLGYWLPFEPYSLSTMGLGSAHTSFNFFPMEHLVKKSGYGISLGFGISFDYLIGMNRTGYEDFLLHSAIVGLPLYTSVLWNYKNKIIFNITPGLLVDILQQDRLYDDTYIENASTFVLTGGIRYEYLIGKKNLAIGLLLNCSAAFYNDLEILLNPSIVFKF